MPIPHLTHTELRARLTRYLTCGDGEVDGDFLMNPTLHEQIVRPDSKPAAVLIGLVERDREMQVILTKRTEGLNNHSGQVAFPGGKIDVTDASPESAALREAWEEIGLDQSEVEVMGRLPDYYSGSGYKIAPVVGLVSSEADFEINPDEVEYRFEVPLHFLMDPRNHKRSSRVFQGLERFYYEMPYGEHHIWGVTAGMIRVMQERLFSHDPD